jgi:hypothetical protein
MPKNLEATLSSLVKIVLKGAPYTSPTETQMREWGIPGLALLVNGKIDLARTALSPLSFAVEQDVEAVCGRPYAMALSQKAATGGPLGDKEWGLYLVDLSAPLRLCIAVPHTGYDEKCHLLAMELWRRVPGCVLAMSTQFRVPDDSLQDYSRATQSLFHRLWTDVLGPRVPQIQVHGFMERGAYPDGTPHEKVVASTGPGRRRLRFAVQIADALAAAGFATRRNWTPSDKADPDLVAELKNRQGAAARVGGWDWMHLEITESVRSNDAARSSLARAVSAALVPSAATVFDTPAYGAGTLQVLLPGRHDTDRLTIGNDTVSSVQVPKGGSVTLYEHTAFAGRSLTLTADTATLTGFDNLTSSIDVTAPAARPTRGAFFKTNGAGTLDAIGILHEDWRATWTHIVPGAFGGNRPGLFFYEAPAGKARFFATNGGNNMTYLGAELTGLPTTWTHIVPGDFDGYGLTDLFCYDAAAGTGAFFTTNGAGALVPLGDVHAGWRPTWTHIVPGSFGGGGRTDLFCYDAAAGKAAFFATNCAGPPTLIGVECAGLSTTWTRVIPGRFGGGGLTELLCYDAITATAQLFTTTGDGKLTAKGTPTGDWRKTWTQIVPGNFGGNANTGLFFYEASTGTTRFCATNGTAPLTLLGGESTGRPTTWTKVVPADFEPGGLTEILCYGS